MGWAWCSEPPHISVTAQSSLYKLEPSGLRGQNPPVFRTGNISRTQRPQTPSSYQFWCKAVCLLHVGWGPDLGYSVVLVLILFLPAENSILLLGENFINVAKEDFVPESITALLRTFFMEILLLLWTIFKATFTYWIVYYIIDWYYTNSCIWL